MDLEIVSNYDYTSNMKKAFKTRMDWELEIESGVHLGIDSKAGWDEGKILIATDIILLHAIGVHITTKKKNKTDKKSFNTIPGQSILSTDCSEKLVVNFL